MGDFTEGGIESANELFIMTTKAVLYWQDMAKGRQTVAYAVSKGHAANLVRAFAGRGISAAAILSDTSLDDRVQAIKNFENRQITVLVNVAVATEGFDLPDASCVLITRPTKSLALYLQMIGRGLRPNKSDGNNCLVLDLAGNAEEHGLPEANREWSLSARGNSQSGDPPVRYCHECNFMAHPAHHKCPECDTDLGKPCPRCGKFRPWSRWIVDCPIEHDTVCDYCDPDVHSDIGVGRYDRKQNSEFYLTRAQKFHTEGNLEAALADYYIAIHLHGSNVGPYDYIKRLILAGLHLGRGTVHHEMGNIELFEEDFSMITILAESLDQALCRWAKLMYEARAQAGLYA